MTTSATAFPRAAASLSLIVVLGLWPFVILPLRACDEDPAADLALAASPYGRAMARMDHQRDRLLEAARAGQAGDARRHAAAIAEAALGLAESLPPGERAAVQAAAQGIDRLAERPAELAAASPGGFSRFDLLFIQLRAPLANAATNQARPTLATRTTPASGAVAPAVVATAATPTIRADLLPQGPLQAGTAIPVTLRLSRLADDSPVTFADLAETHTRRIHLLIVDESLGDYQHEHPEETATPGEYAFTWQPHAGGRYHLFADLLPIATARQEYVPAMLQVSGAPLAPRHVEQRTVTVDGYRFDLVLPDGDAPLRAGEHATVRVRVTAPDGRPATDLEPVMGAFAHGVGFSTDLRSVLHVHPLGEEPKTAAARGGPDLDFHFLSEQPGFRRFYVQVRLHGQDRYAPFGLAVTPGSSAPAPPPVRLVAASVTPVGGPLTADDQRFLAAYERIRTALAADDLPAAIAAAETLPGGVDGSVVLNAGSLASARAGFTHLSARALPLAAGRPGFFVLHCPMAQQNWVQTEARVANPFYGRAMLTCGSLVQP